MASMPGGAPGARLQAIQGTVPALGDAAAGLRVRAALPDRFEPCDVRAARHDTSIGGRARR